MRLRSALLALLALFALTGEAAETQQAAPAGAEPANPFEGNAEAIASGRKLYMRMSCHGCHGGNARGGTGPDLTDEQWLRQPTDEMIFNTIKNGRPGTMMSPFRSDMDDDQIWYLVAYIRELGRVRKAEGR
jgi:cytochrome c oxidase cbb3-type subunit 3